MVDQVVEVCKRNTGVRLAMVIFKQQFWSNCHIQIDHISSPSAIVFPIAKLAKELHKLGVLLLVDGAHAPGQVRHILEWLHGFFFQLELDLENLGADFYTGLVLNWAFTQQTSLNQIGCMLCQKML